MAPSRRANPLTLSLRQSSRSPPDLQYLATIFRFMPYLFAISLKFGVVPDWRCMFSSPIRSLSIRATIGRPGLDGSAPQLATVEQLATPLGNLR